jgi:hypothetical protein
MRKQPTPTSFLGRHMPFFIHKRALSEDSFTFGNWRQYIAKRDDGALQPVRKTMIPGVLVCIGLCLLELVGLAVFLTPVLVEHPRPITNWDYVYTLTFLGFMCFGVGMGLIYGEYKMVVPVGPKVYDGRRRFWSEETDMIAQTDQDRRVMDRRS